MKPNLGWVVLVAVVSSAVTAGVLELLRGPTRTVASEPRPTEPRPSAMALPKAIPLRPAAQPLDLDLDLDGRLRAVERRLDQLQLAARTTREPVVSSEDEPAERAELRELVLDWVAEEREARRREAEQNAEEERKKEREFEIRVEARKMAAEHALPGWEEENLVAVWIEVETKREEMHAGFDQLTSDPADVERQLTEFEEWVKRRAVDAMGPERANQLFGF